MSTMSDAIGVLFWTVTFAAFSFPVWGPIAGVMIGFLLGASIQ